jgi:hypothetical protein
MPRLGPCQAGPEGPGQRRAFAPCGTETPRLTAPRDASAVRVGGYGLAGAPASAGIGFWLIMRWA